MLTLRAAADLLAACDSLHRADALLAPLGFAAPTRLTDALRASLGLPEAHGEAHICTGPGALRALSVALSVDDDGDAADTARALARRVGTRARQVLWLVVVVQQRPRCVVIAAPPADPQRAVPMLVVSGDHVVDSDAETFASLVAAAPAGASDVVVHERWVEMLGREALNRRFYRALERGVHALAADARGGRSPDDRADAALLCSSRLLFLAFLQGKGWLDRDRDFLAHAFDRGMRQGGGFHRRTLRALFFGTLNTPRRSRAPVARSFGEIPFLNGGLFAPAPVECGRRPPELSDASLGRFLHDVLGRYRFTAREDRLTHTDAAVDPEMLGRAFESLMASRERRASGTYYTPSGFVPRLADTALAAALERLLPATHRRGAAALAAGGAPDPADRAASLCAIGALTVLDPACGSGALLVHALERVSRWRALAGDARAPDVVRREVLARAIFGVDRNPTAVWLCELRLWLAVAVECAETDPRRVLPLPNLDRNIRAGDALMAPLAADGPAAARPGTSQRIATLRDRYARAAGVGKQRIAQALDRAEREAAVLEVERELASVTHHRRDLVAARRGRDLFGERHAPAVLAARAAELRERAASLRRERRRIAGGGALPFRYDVHFADVMAQGGFAAVLGNPPWVRLHRIDAAERAVLRERFVVLRDAAWLPGARLGGAGPGFAGQADLAALFVERSLRLLRERGVLALLVPAKLWTALAGGGVRRLLRADARLLAIEDCSEAPELFDAVTYPSLLVAERCTRDAAVADQPQPAACVVHRGSRAVRWNSEVAAVALDGSPGSPWLLLPPPARSAFERVRGAGLPLAERLGRRPLMGVKCGTNDAFIVSVHEDAGARAHSRVSDRHGRTGAVEAALLRPVLRGEQVRAWRTEGPLDRIIWTHDARGPLAHLPPLAAQWLAPYRARLVTRSDARGTRRWWALHRTEGAEAAQARVVWPDLARTPRAVWLAPGDPLVPLNSCYVLPCATLREAQALAALLNSPLAAAWLRSVAEPARGGYRRMFAWTTALLPLPADWDRACDLLADAAVRAVVRAPTPNELLDVTLAAYRLRRADIAPLLEWHPSVT